MLDWLSDGSKGSVATIMAAGTILDFELLDKLPKGVLISIIGLSFTALGWFVKRDIKRIEDRDNEAMQFRDRIIAVETELKLIKELSLHRHEERNETHGE